MRRARLLLAPLIGVLAASGLSLLPPRPVSAAPVPGAPLVALDPGHDSRDVGAATTVDGRALIEKDLTLAVAEQAAEILERTGYRVVLTRRDHAPVDQGRDLTGDGRVSLADNLQARIDRANAAGADVLVSIHFNGAADPRLRGPEVYFSPDRGFEDDSRRLATLVLGALRARLGELGARVDGRGVLSDRVLGGGPLYLLGPAGGRIARASTMPAVLSEALYLTNPEDARLMAEPRVRAALAQAYADAVAAYLGPPARRAVVTAPTGANLRPSPLLSAAPLAVVPRGAPVELAELAHGDPVGDATGWWRVSWDGQAGFVFGSLVQPVPSSRAAPAAPAGAASAAPAALADAPPAHDALPRRALVRDTGDGLAALLRGRPSRGAPILIRARAGERLEVLDEEVGEAVDGRERSWLKVRRGNTVGWVWAPLLDARAG